MVSMRLAAVLPLLLLAAIQSFGATFTVSKDGRGQYNTVQAAVNAAGKNDVVRILDAAVYAEQVTIDSLKAGLTLTSANPFSSKKPLIRYQDLEHVGPRTCTEAKSDSMVTFDQNGALRIMWTRNVTIDGIAVDGGGAYAYGYNGVWDGDQPCQYPLQHGNQAITLWVSGDIQIRNCDISNAYIGINVKDRNEGGIFANANPADIDPWNVVPLSGFAQSGNHLFEYNRIHDNSFGMFFESTWDLGSTIRRNLLYNNFHHGNLGARVKALTSEGNNQPGGALWFKDHLLSPLAIYNNTFYNNFLIFVGHWRAGSQHLIFNNIYGPPSTYWSRDANFQNPWTKMDPVYVYRMKNCVYAAQTQAPTSRIVEAQEYDQGIQAMVKDTVLNWEVRIMNDMGEVEQTDITTVLTLSDRTVTKTLTGMRVPGNRILGQTGKAFPAEATIRWLETPFKSTDPASPDFLVPDWNDSLVQTFIIDQGWPEAGVRDPDGTIADLGAIPFNGGYPEDRVVIKPISPVIINGTNATMTFDVSVAAGSVTGPVIKYIRFIKNLEFFPDVMGGNVPPIPATDIIEVTGTGNPVNVGSNSLTVTVPVRGADERYAFFEIIVEGTGSNGEIVTSNVGFMPFRKMEYGFNVEVLDITKTVKLSEVTVGDTVMIRVSALKAADNTPFQNQIAPVEVNLNSGADLFDVQNGVFKFPDGILISATRPAVFTRVPDGGTEYVMVSGLWDNNDNSLAFYGVSDAVIINPGPPAAVQFQTPPSNTLGGTNPPVIDPGIPYPGEVQVFDRYGNKVKQSVQLALSSSAPLKADLVGAKTINTNAAGLGTFNVMVQSGGQENDVFTLSAEYNVTIKDFADMKIGRPLDQFWVFYGDEGNLDPLAELRGQVGEKLKATIWASKDGMAVLTARTNTVSLNTVGTSRLSFYDSEASTTPITAITLAAGAADVWITSLEPVSNGGFEVFDETDGTILSGTYASRQKIFFSRAKTVVDSAFFYADNGIGAVNRVEIYYRKDLPAKPDSLILYWPNRTASPQTIAASSPLVVLDADNRHLTVTLAAPFGAGITTGNGSQGSSSGTSWDRPNPDVPAEGADFVIGDRVGPLLAAAEVIEKFASENESFTVTFTERVNETTVSGAAFELFKPGSTDPIILTVVPNSVVKVGVGTIISFQTADLGVNTPETGDSIRIRAAGPLTDAQGNHAHSDNVRVPVVVRSRPAPPLAAWYVDRNADGVVEAVQIQFPKAVDKTILSTKVAWDGDTALVGSQLMTYGTPDSTIVSLNVTSLFGATPKTGGSMAVAVVYLDGQSDTTFTTAAADSAAPVIVSASYSPGTIYDESTRDPDNLTVVFSEAIRAIGSTVVEPFDLSSTKIGRYSVRATAAASDGNTVAFSVDTIFGGTDYPWNHDAIWISVDAGIADAQGGIVQSNRDNRRALITVEPRPYKIAVKAGPNPFNPATSVNTLVDNGMTVRPDVRGIIIAIDPLANLGDPADPAATRLTFSIVIYDAQGNIVAQSPGLGETMISVIPSPYSSKVFINWTGQNDAGRYVGAGSYLAMLTVEDNLGKKNLSRIILAVVR